MRPRSGSASAPTDGRSGAGCGPVMESHSSRARSPPVPGANSNASAMFQYGSNHRKRAPMWGNQGIPNPRDTDGSSQCVRRWMTTAVAEAGFPPMQGLSAGAADHLQVGEDGLLLARGVQLGDELLDVVGLAVRLIGGIVGEPHQMHV